LTGGWEAGIAEVGDDEAKQGDFLIEAGDGMGAGIVFKLAGIEFAGVETVLEGVGVAGLPAWATRGGHMGDPFGTRIEELS
jgi:hypothetical protein